MAKFPAYQASTGCRNAGPGANALISWIVGDFKRGARNFGVCNCRTVRGKSTPSIHGECRACDAGFPLVRGRANPNGTVLLSTLLPHVNKLGIQCIIWNRGIWSSKAPNGTRYNGVHPHYDHLHIELTRHAARYLTVATIRAAVAGVAGPVKPPASIIKTLTLVEEDDEDMGSYIRDEKSGAIYHIYGERYRHLSRKQWEARQSLAKLSGKVLPVSNMHPLGIAKFLIDMELIKDPT